MKFSFFLLLFVMIFNESYSQSHNPKKGMISNEDGHILFNQHDAVWGKGPASLPAGARAMVLEGDLSKAGPFTVRIMLPANYRIGPHFHPAVEHVTVIEGNFYMGSGEVFNAAAATRISKGGLAVMPIGYKHFAYTKGRTIIQLHGVGPWGITYVNDADDPRKNAGK